MRGNGHGADPLSGLAQRASSLKVLVGIGLALILAGATGLAFVFRFESKADADRSVRSLRATDRDHESRLIRQETNLDWIKSTLYELARRQGINPSPPPP